LNFFIGTVKSKNVDTIFLLMKIKYDSSANNNLAIIVPANGGNLDEMYFKLF
jgi:hypothetical protein